MKKQKNISFILIIAILLTQIIAQNVFAERVASGEEIALEEEAEAVELLSESYPKEFSSLYGLGILKGDIESNAKVTRADFATMLYAFCKEQIKGSLGFRDIDPDTELADAVKAVTNYGYLGGYGDGTFRPNEPVTYIQAVYALLTMAGYKDLAEIKGGYPNGYLSIATNKKPLSGYNEDAELMFGDVVRLFYKFLKLNVVKVEFSNNEQNFYESEITVLEEMLKVYEGKGLVFANSNSSIKGRNRTKNGEAIVNYKGTEATVNVGASNIDKYVGYNVKYYFDDEDRIVFCEVNEDSNTILEVDEEHYENIDKKLTQISYQKDGGSRTYAKISDTADFIYNGTSCYNVTQADFDKADFVRLIDNDGDSKYDVVYIYVYESFMVKNVSYKEKIIEDQRDDVFYAFEENARDIVYQRNGYPVSFDSIKEWDVLNIEIGKTADSLITVNISADIVSGEVEQIEKNERKITIGGEEYYVSKKINIDTILLKTELVGALNHFGAIVCVKQIKQDKGYIYLEEIRRDRKTELITLIGMNASGQEEELTLSEKFNINNEKSDWDGLTEYIDNDDPNKDYGKFQAVYQLMSYVRRPDGTVKNIYFGASTGQGARDAAYSNELVLNKKMSNARIRTQFATINAEYLYEKSTPIFVIVTDDITNEIIKDMSYVRTQENLKLVEGTRPPMKIYDAGTERIAKAVVIEIKKSQLTGYFDVSSRQGFLVTKIRTVLNADNEVIREVVGISNGAETVYRQSDLYDFSNWKVGELWIVTNDLDYHVISAKKLFELLPTPNIPDGKAVWDLNTGNVASDYTETHTGVYGTLLSVTNATGSKTIRIRPDGSTEDVVYGISGTSITIYRSSSGKFEPISSDHLSVGIGSGKVFCYTRYGLCRDIIIID